MLELCGLLREGVKELDLVLLGVAVVHLDLVSKALRLLHVLDDKKDLWVFRYASTKEK